MHEPEDTAIEQVESEAPESEDFDLSDEALDRPHGGRNLATAGGAWCVKFCG